VSALKAGQRIMLTEYGAAEMNTHHALDMKQHTHKWMYGDEGEITEIDLDMSTSLYLIMYRTGDKEYSAYAPKADELFYWEGKED
jgi:hypothetical protein